MNALRPVPITTRKKQKHTEGSWHVWWRSAGLTLPLTLQFFWDVSGDVTKKAEMAISIFKIANRDFLGLKRLGKNSSW